MNFPNKIGPYSVYGILGSGAYGKVFAVRNPKTLQDYAMKTSESKKSLKKEYKILKTLSQSEDFMKVHEYGTLKTFDYIVMERFSKNLQYKNNDPVLSINCISAIGLEVLSKVEAMHSFNILHRDIKPSQFLLNEEKTKVYLVDFGVSTYYRKHNVHRAFKDTCRFKGSVLFSSVNTHLGHRQSRRDDLESFCYSLVYLVKGLLPWGIDPNLDVKMNMKQIIKCKTGIKTEVLFKDIPIEFQNIYKYIKQLSYAQTPNYDYIRNLLVKHTPKEPIFNNFDWISDPDFFGKMVSIIENNENSQILIIKNSNGEFIAKRRTGQIDTGVLKRFSKSFDVRKIEEIVRKHETCSRKRKTKKTYLCIDDASISPKNLHDFNKNEKKKRTVSHEEQVSEEPVLTDRCSPPKFRDRETIISIRNDFLAKDKRNS